MRTVHQTLSLLRRERGLSQRQAAGALGVSQAQLSHYETGAREPGLPFVCRACDYYGVTADYMLGRSEIPGALDTERLFGSIRGLIDSAEKQLEHIGGEQL